MSVRIRRLVVFGVCAAACLVCLFVLLLRHIGGASSSARMGASSGGGPMSSQTSDACYPNLPHEVATIKGGNRVAVLASADRLRDIVGWAEDSFPSPLFASVRSGKPDADCFVVMYDIGFGLYVWRYLAYARYEEKGVSKWHLLCTGPVVSTGKGVVIDHLYVDGAKGALVFATRDGKVLRSVPIMQPLEALKGKGDRR